MIKKRTEIEIPQGDGSIKHKTILESEEVKSKDPRSKIIKYAMLREIVNNPDLAGSGNLDFEKMVIEHLHGKWVIKTIALEPAPEET